MTCPNCGHENEEDDKYCANCGERLKPRFEMPDQFPEEQREQAPEERSATVVPATEPEPRSEDPTDPEWRMSPLPPPEPPKRRVWLWVLAGLIIFCVLLFCGFGVFLTTDPGRDFLDDLGTRAAEVATESP